MKLDPDVELDITTLAARVREIYPSVRDEDVLKVLWNATSFPMGSSEEVLQQLREHKDAGCKTPLEAIARADTHQFGGLRVPTQNDPNVKALLSDPKLFWAQVPTDKIEAFHDAMPCVAGPWEVICRDRNGEAVCVSRGVLVCQKSEVVRAATTELSCGRWVADKWLNSLPETVRFESKEQAMAFLDANLLERGWRLL